MRRRWLTFGGMAILALAVGTTGVAVAQAEAPENAAAATAGEPPPSSFPTGCFVDVDNGRWMLEFDEDGTAETSVVFGHDWRFTYAVDGDTFTWLGSEYSNLGGGADVAGESRDATYRWDYDGEQLAFESIGEDAADQRKTRMSYAYRPIEDPQVVMVATIDLDAGDPIRAWEAFVPAAEVGPDAYTSKVEYLGHVAAVPIAKGQPITPDLVAPTE